MEAIGKAITGQAIPIALNSAGATLATRGRLRQGEAAKISSDFEAAQLERQAAQLEQNAGQQIASSQRAAIEEQRQARLAQSRVLAVAAASGGGASDPTVVNLMARLAGEGAYRGMVDLYQGQEKARQMRTQAEEDRYSAETIRISGEVAKSNSRYTAAATALSGATSLYTRFALPGKPAEISSAGMGINNTGDAAWKITGGGYGGFGGGT